MKLHVALEHWPFAVPFRITGHTWEVLDVLVVNLEHDGYIGRGEAAGVFFRHDHPASMVHEVEALRPRIEAGVTLDSLQALLPAGGARNALDCALWDLRAKIERRPVWQLAGLDEPRPLLTSFTCGADTPQRMAARARSFTSARAIKLKLTGEPGDADRVLAVREARMDVWLGVDANQGLTRSSLDRLLPTLLSAEVKLIEQPFPVGEEQLLESFSSPIPIAADESVRTLGDLQAVRGRCQVVNIKLDKCGGLTEALAMARAARELGLEVMVGNMHGTSLAMAPAFIVGQLCNVVDLDGPVSLTADRSVAAEYKDGFIFCPDQLWGGAN
jgi:L-Ala-D/L-Glu epimerase